MFYVDGWTPLREVSLTVSRRRVREHGEQLKIHGVGGADRSLLTRSGTCGEVWEICANAKEVGVLLSNGAVAKASRDLVRDESEDQPEECNRYVDLFDGTVGSGLHVDGWGVPLETWDENYLRVRYGPFFGLPVLLSEECLTVAKNGGNQVSSASLDQSPKAISDAVVRLFDAGEKHMRLDYKEIVAPDVSFRSFQTAWALAREERPELKTPGRKPRRQ
ncbi:MULTISPECIES: hypothetical protein [unclassified Ruegeria]|uniref:hypothetical protein n=1 Tax=unclassified Ruegeria TaxID=2625375 RepID=UPI001488DAFA|nr:MULTISPECIES: hypothetical protein [unclassified Ruegeria]